MRVNPDDPRLTAYILGELDAEERQRLEEEVAACPESREHVAQLRATAELLRAELGQELASAEPAGEPEPRRRWWRGKRRMWVALSAAASVLIVVGFGVGVLYQPRVLYNKAIEIDKLDEAEDTGVRHRGEEGRLTLSTRPHGATVFIDGKPWSKVQLNVPTTFETKNQEGKPGTEAYATIQDNPFRLVSRFPLSTFAVDVDTAAYANVRRFLRQNTLPPRDAVRIEELVNYFSYSYPQPQGRRPFAVHVDQASCPWRAGHQLVRVGLKGKELDRRQRPVSNLVFLLDVSGSMADENKLPLLRQALDLLVRQLSENDRVAIAVYAGASGLVLPSTSCTEANRPRIRAALERLQAGGSTNGGEGIELAYNVAVGSFIPGGVNRVILATDGDFNVGVTSQEALVKLIQEKAKSKVFLSVLGFGMGNYKDATLEQLANKGNGNYAYIDTLNEARKVLVEQLSGTLVTIAKDVKIQVEFNPARVAAYRLIGYENRLLKARDFDDDTKDAGEIGAGHTVTALYEVVPAGSALPPELRLKYQQPSRLTGAARTAELMTVKLRYKEPEAETSQLLELPVPWRERAMATASVDLRFAAAVAWFGMVLRGSPYAGRAPDPLREVHTLAQAGRGVDRHGYRAEFLELVQLARRLSQR